MSGDTPEDIQKDIEAQREKLAETVDQLAAKLDVKSQAKAKVAQARDVVTTDEGKPRPDLLAGAGVAVAALVILIIWRQRR